MMDAKIARWLQFDPVELDDMLEALEARDGENERRMSNQIAIALSMSMGLDQVRIEGVDLDELVNNDAAIAAIQEEVRKTIQRLADEEERRREV